MMWDVQGFQNEWFRNSAAWKSGKSIFSREVRKSTYGMKGEVDFIS